MGLAGTKQSWHYEYKDSAWVFIGGLPYELTGKYIYEFNADIFIGLLPIFLVDDHFTS